MKSAGSGGDSPASIDALGGHDIAVTDGSLATNSTQMVTRRSKANPNQLAQSNRNSSAKKAKVARNKIDIMSDPRLKDFMDRAKYEAFVDPYRGIFPFFNVSYRIEESQYENEEYDENANDQVAGESIHENGLKVSQRVFVDTHPAIIISIDKNEKTAEVRWDNQRVDTVKLEQIIPHEARVRKTRRKMEIDTKHNEMDMAEQASPWLKCSTAFDSSTWKYTCPVGVQVINLDNPDEKTEKTTTLLQCNCHSINEWAQQEWEAVEKKRVVAALKKKKRRKKKEVVVVDECDSEQEKGGKKEIGIQGDEIICGRRSGGECACDYNPFCLFSLGGIFDEYRYNIAKTKLIFPESSNSTTDNEEFNTQLRKCWSEMPKYDEDNNDEQKTDDEISNIRSDIMIEKQKIQSHLATHISDGELTSEKCMEMLLNHHKCLIFPSMQKHLTKCNSKVQLSKPPGLKNLGATCYLNSQLQCLAQNLGFMHAIMRWKPTTPALTDTMSMASTKRMNNVLSSMQSILARMRYGYENVICTNEFALALGLENDEMQDPNEFSGLLLDRIQDSFRQCANMSGQTGLENLLPSIFYSKSSITTTCSECEHLSKRVDEFKFLPIPIVDCNTESPRSRQEGVSDDVDVQQLLDFSMHPETMDGDNQYFCSRCNKKVDAIRSPKFESLPPVLNLQLNRYVFNMETFSKHKLATKVLLSHTLVVPLGNTEQKTYVLVAVQNHLGNSAHGGHYIANVLDWKTGVWFEFNDETVNILENGPLSGFHSEEASHDKKGTLRKIYGSEDAYNLLYVEKNYMSTSTRNDFVRCAEGDVNARLTNDFVAMETEDKDTYQFYSNMRAQQFRLEQEEKEKMAKTRSRLAFRKEQLKNELFCSGFKTKAFYMPACTDNVLISTKVLQRFLSCTDGLEDIFKCVGDSILDNKSLLCQHGSGIHPSTGVQLKMLTKEFYTIIAGILKKEYDMFTSEERGTTALQPINACNLMLRDDDEMVCGICSRSHMFGLQRKFNILENLIQIYIELHGESNKDNANPSNACAISKYFATSFCTYVESLVKSLLSTSKTWTNPTLPVTDVNCLDFGELFKSNRALDNTVASEMESKKENLDTSVNSRITCDHGNCNVMYNQRSTRFVPKTLWSKIVQIFPGAIMHKYQPPNEKCIGNCRQCFVEKELDDRFPVDVKQWKINIDENSILMGIINGRNLAISSGGGFSALHRDQVQGWRYCHAYLSHSRKRFSNQVVREKLLQLCPLPSSMLICAEHHMTIIPNYSRDDQQNMGSLKECNLELLTEMEYLALLGSISDLRQILIENNESSVAGNPTKPPRLTVNSDYVLLLAKPEICDKGCAFALCNSEVKKEEAQDQSLKESDAKSVIEKEKVFNICVHDVDGSNDLNVAASAVIASLSTELLDGIEFLHRRSRRKKNRPGGFQTHSVKVPTDCNLAHLRLLVLEQTGRKLFRQYLYLVEDSGAVVELLEKDNTKDFSAFVANQADDIHILMTYKDIHTLDHYTSAGTKKRPARIEAEVEENIISTLTELAFRGIKSDEFGSGAMKKSKRRREERGFRGTFLHSSPFTPKGAEGDESEINSMLDPVNITSS